MAAEDRTDDPCTTNDGAPTARTDINTSGNRVFDATLDLESPRIDIALGTEPAWILPATEPGAWYVSLVDDTAVIVSADGAVVPTQAPPPGEPPQLRTNDDGDLVVESAYDDHGLFTDPLVDTRVVHSGPHAAALVGPTNRYAHGVLGDEIEASAVEIVNRCTNERTRIEIDDPTVIEGISPLLADLDGDGKVEVLVTTSNSSRGGQLDAYRIDGSFLASSEPIGQGNRWRNQLGVAPLGPNGEIEVVDVRIPHIGGVVEFFRLDGDRLVRVAQTSEFTSHAIGSRNLDMGILADTTGDGRPEVVALTQNRDGIASLQRSGEDGVEQVGQVELDGRATTNLAVQDLPNGAALAAGTTNGTLHIWMPA